MLFHDAVAQALSDQGVSVIFGLLGDANLYMTESFVRTTGGSFYAVTHECAGVLAANAYAKTTGRLGVASVTHGPGLTNTMTALVEAVKDHASVLILAGDTAVVDKDNWQSIPQRDLVLSVGAGFEQVRAPSTVVEDVAVAVRRAILEKRPIVLNVPSDYQWQDIEYQRTPPRFVEAQAVSPDPDALDEAVGVIASARRPIVLAGRGASSPEAREALLRLARRLGAPIATSLLAKDLFRGEQFDLGIAGTLSNPVASEALTDSDCVVAFGASLNLWTTAKGSLLANKQVVHVDIDPSGIGRYSPVNYGIVGDASVVADTIVAYLDQAEVPPTGFASDELAQRLADYSDENFADQSTDSTVDIRTALIRIDQAFPAERTVVVDGGRFVLHCFTLLHVPQPSAYVHTINYSSVGLGPGSAIGAAVGAPHRPVLHVCGDGGFMMSGMPEFNTAVRYGLDLVVVVMNDGSYGAEHIQLRNRQMDPSITMFDWPDFAQLATALGGQGIAVRNLVELDDALGAIQRRTGPVLIDVKLDPDKIDLVGL